MDNKTNKPKFKLAPQKKQKLVEDIQDIFLERVLDIEKGALVTDETYISDFIFNPKDRAIRKGSNGKMVFVKKIYVGPFFHPMKDWERWKAEKKNPENWKLQEEETYPGLGSQEVIAKTKEVFGVDITDQYDKPFVEILMHIAMNFRSSGRRGN